MSSPESERQDVAEGPVPAQTNQWFRTPTMLLGLFSVCFLIGSIRAAASNYLWMDEVLAVWAAKLSSVQLVWAALFHGAEASPPTYHLLLHSLIKAGAGSYMLLRLPSILGAFVSALCVFVLLRKYLDTTAAAFGMTFSLVGVLAWYGVEARPYTLVTACFAIAVLLWDGAEWEYPQIWRVATIAFLLALSICFHFYAALLVPCMAAMELLWWVANRRIRIPMWIALFVGGASSFMWLPFIRVDRAIIANEVRSSGFYAKPTLGRLLQAYADLSLHDKKQVLFIALTLAVIFAASALQRLRTSTKPDKEPRAVYLTGINLYVIGFCTAAFPVLVFVFAFFSTKTFNTRYVLVGSIGFSIFAAYAVSRLRLSNRAMCTIVLLACPLAFLRGSPPESVHIPDQLEVLSRASVSQYPIIVPDARLYFELAEAAPASLKSRLVYVDLPPGTRNPDPTNEHHVDRWHQIRPELRIMSARDFLTHNSQFYVFHTTAYIYVITNWLMERKLIERPIAEDEDNWLFQARAPEAADDNRLMNANK